MTRPGSPVASHRRVSSWLFVAGSLVVYLGLVAAMSLVGLRPDLPLPWWAAQAVPPLVYTALVLLVARPRSAIALASGVALLWVAHLCVGALTLAVLAMLDGSSIAGLAATIPPPLPALVWVPVLLIPLRDALRGEAARRPGKPVPAANRRVTAERRAPAPPAAPVSPAAVPATPAFERRATTPPRPTAATPVVSMEPRFDAPRRPAGPPAPAAPARPPVQAPPPAPPPEKASTEPANAVAPPPADRLLEELLARDDSKEPVRISFERVRGQLPAEGFARPLEQLSQDLTVPGALLVPRRLVLAQLAEGMVRADWDHVAAQFPDQLIATSHDEIKAQLPAGELVLPLDEIARQFPPAVFMASAPAPDVSGIEAFPAPFQPIEAVEETGASEAEDELCILRPGEHPVPRPSEPSAPTVTTGMARDDRATKRGVEATRWAAGAVRSGASASGPSAFVGAADVSATIGGAEEPAPVIPPAVAATAPALLDAAIAAPRHQDADMASRTIGQTRSAAATSRDDVMTAVRELMAVLAPLGLSHVQAGDVEGFKVIATGSSGLGDDVMRGAARLVLPVLARGRAAWPVEQVTLRGPRAALVFTPFGPLSAGGPVVAAIMPRGGALALLELRCRQAAAGHAARTGVPIAEALQGHDDGEEPELLDVEPSTRIREVASSLRALGTVAASHLRDAQADRAVYLFAPPGGDVRTLGALATELSQAMRQASLAGVVFHSAVLRSRARGMVIQLPATVSGRSDMIVAAGETDRPGLAYRQVEHAAVLLGAL